MGPFRTLPVSSRVSLVAVAALLCGTGCLPPPRLPAEPHDAVLNQPIRLPIGGTAAIRGEDLRIWFHTVASDSRCPVEVQCIHPGDAVVRLGAARGFGEQEIIDLRVGPAAAAVVHGPYTIRAMDLEPLPRAGDGIDPAEYVATIVISRS
jgi:hypothetical protein